MTRLLLSFTLIFSSAIGFAQDSLFSKVYVSVNHPYTISSQVVDSYKNIAQVGEANFNDGSYSYLDSLGNVLFSKTYTYAGGPYSGLKFHSIKSTSDKKFIAVGEIFFPSFGVGVGVCMKIDSTGEVIWVSNVAPGNPIFFKCTDVLESSEGTYWISGYDSQSGQSAIIELDASGTQLNSSSFQSATGRLETRAIIEVDTNNLLIVGAELDQSGNSKGHVLAIQKPNTLLWSKSVVGNYFFDAEQNDESIWIASSMNGQMGILTMTHDGNFTHSVGYAVSILNTEFVGFSLIKDSTLAFCNGSNYQSFLLLAEANTTNARYCFPQFNATAIQPSNNGGLYVAGNGPMYGIKSLNDFEHSGLIRYNDTLMTHDCSIFIDGFVTTTNGTPTAQDLTLTLPSAPVAGQITLLAADQVLTTYLGCVDYYSGLEEYDANGLTLFPNPANNVIQLRFENASSGTFEIVSMDGKLVQQSTISGSNTSISVGQLVAGTYLYRFTSAKNAVSRGKLVIE